MATTFAEVRNRIKSVIEAATPSVNPIQDPFRYKPSNSHSLQEWAESCPAACLRHFSILRVGDSPDNVNGILDVTEVQREEQAQITIAYPRLHDIYGESYESMEDCMRADARQVRDLLISGSTASAVSGWHGVKSTVIHEPTRDGTVWYQSITATIFYCESQTYT